MNIYTLSMKTPGFSVSTAIQSNRQVYAAVNFDCNFIFPCDRCLEDFGMNINGNFEAVYKYSRDPEELDSGEGGNIFFIAPEMNFIDLTELVREYILISLPMRKAPGETDGRCDYCGKTEEEILQNKTTQEINPVWDKLLNKKNLK
ncbi:MAG: DUF177 domain-containing protein [Bacteroidetes bacterium]|nr:DUF177 domain-containing protein [Bacteroidota bacterium]